MFWGVLEGIRRGGERGEREGKERGRGKGREGEGKGRGRGREREGKGKGIYIFHKRGGTANANTQFQNQLLAVAKLTAFARILFGKISAGYVQLVGPHVVAKVQTNRYVIATIAFDTALLFGMSQEMLEFEDVVRGGELGTP